MRCILTIFGTARIVGLCGTGSTHLSGVSLSVRPLIYPSLTPGRNMPLLQVCCCGPGGQKISIVCCTAGVRQANAGSATLSAYVVAEHRLIVHVLKCEYDLSVKLVHILWLPFTQTQQSDLRR